MKFAIYKEIPGKILRTVSCPLEMVEYQTQEDEFVIIISEDTRDDLNYIDENHIAILYPERPSLFHIFNFTNGQWEDPRTLQDFKDAKWNHIKSERSKYLTDPLTTAYGIFDGDSESQNNIKGAIQLSDKLLAFGQPSDIEFTLADNSRITLTNTELNMVGFALGARTNTAYSHGSDLRIQIEAVTNVEDLDEITWNP